MKTQQKIKLAEAEAERRKKLIPPSAEEIGVVIDDRIKQYHDKIVDIFESLQPILDKMADRKDLDHLIELSNSLVQAIAAIESGITVENQVELKDLVISNLKDIVIPDKVFLQKDFNLEGFATDETLKTVFDEATKHFKKMAQEVHNFVKANAPKDQTQEPGDFIPYRRVIMLGNKLVFDDSSFNGLRFPVPPAPFVDQQGNPRQGLVDNAGQIILSNPGGGGGGSSEVINETPTGTKNGVNKTFTTFYDFKPGTTKLYLNGIRQAEGVGNDYAEQVDHLTITFTNAPQSSDVLIIDYYKL